MEVYYFSGTGNCLAVARAITAHTGGTLVSIPEVIGRSEVSTHADIIGVVFPTYLAPLYGIPLIVDIFFRKLERLGSKYLFAVCTCGGYEIANAVPTLRHLAKLIRSLGGKLSAEYSVRLPMNNLSYDHIPVPIEKSSEVILRRSEATIEDVSERISASRRGKHHFLRAMFNFAMTPMYSMLKKPCLTSLKAMANEPADSKLGFRDLMPFTDKSIRVDDNCNACGICTKVCPVHNIQIVDKKPVWQHHCEICFACDEWCPQKAIHHWSRADGVKYHHPTVKTKDMYAVARS
jgi:formate hydrogenlyase subunit 6/NADH:ubiquinone oxidoreductase subunit I/flavodoxin